jgi:hypothetical protein
MPDEPEDGISVGWVAALLAMVVAYAGWAFMAADFFQHDPNAGGGERSNFFVNSFVQLPRFVSVCSHALSNRLWLVILIAIIEVMVIFLWIFMRRLERELRSK